MTNIVQLTEPQFDELLAGFTLCGGFLAAIAGILLAVCLLWPFRGGALGVLFVFSACLPLYADKTLDDVCWELENIRTWLNWGNLRHQEVSNNTSNLLNVATNSDFRLMQIGNSARMLLAYMREEQQDSFTELNESLNQIEVDTFGTWEETQAGWLRQTWVQDESQRLASYDHASNSGTWHHAVLNALSGGWDSTTAVEVAIAPGAPVSVTGAIEVIGEPVATDEISYAGPWCGMRFDDESAFMTSSIGMMASTESSMLGGDLLTSTNGYTPGHVYDSPEEITNDFRVVTPDPESVGLIGKRDELEIASIILPGYPTMDLKIKWSEFGLFETFCDGFELFHTVLAAFLLGYAMFHHASTSQ